MNTGAEEVPIRLEDLKRKMPLTGKVIKSTLAGAIVDFGLDVPGMLHISQLQKEPVNRVEDVIQVGQTVNVWVRRVDLRKRRVELTMIEPLDLEWREIKKGMVVSGTVTRLEKYGIFVEIGAERPGLVHISELTHGFIRTPREVVKEGDEVRVKVLWMNRRRKQIKLSMKALERAPKKVVKKEEKPQKKAKPVPTAMEVALRDAMERAHKSETSEERKETQEMSKPSASSAELDDILSRTLDDRMKSTSK